MQFFLLMRSVRSTLRTFGLAWVTQLAFVACLCLCACSGSEPDARQVEQQALTTPIYQIDCGGGAVSPFAADQFATGGSTYASSNVVSTSGVANAAPAAVYQTERFGNHSYTFGSLTPGSSYTVRLHFAEIYFTAAGFREFDVLVNGTQVLTNLDIFATVGANTALVRDFTTTATSSGQITIQYVNVVENAKSSGIEILSTSSTSNQAPTVATAAAASPSPATGTSAALSVLGADDGGEANLIYTWSTAGTAPGAVSFSTNASNAAKHTTATFSQAGSYNLVATVVDSSGASVTSSVALTVSQSLTSIGVTPASTQVQAGATQQFSASALDQFGAPMATQPAFTWTASGGGSVSSSGLFSAASASGGPFTVSATSGNSTGAASLTVAAAPVAPSPPPSSGTAAYQINCGGGAVSPFAADQFSTGGSTYATSNAVSTAGVTNAAPAAVYQTERFGNHSYTFGNLTPGSSYTVRLHFAEVYFTSAGSREFNVLVNGTQVLTNLDIFATAGANHALVRDFSSTASSSGQITIQYVNVIENAKSSGIEILSSSGTSGGTGNAPPTVQTAAAANPNPVTGSSAALSVLGADDSGETSLTYTWATTGTPPGAVSFSANASNAAKNAMATFTQAGSYVLAATIMDASGASVTSSVSVTVAQSLSAVSVSPASAQVQAGSSQQFAATARDQFGDAINPQPSFAWTASGGGTVSSSGLFSAGSTSGGPFTVSAVTGSTGGAADVTVGALSSGTCPSGAGPCVDVSARLQTIDGFGGAIAYDVPFVATAQSAQFLFSTDNAVSFAGGTYPGIGLTLIRVGMLPDGTTASFTWPSVSMALAVNPAILVWGAPWSPTASFKTTDNVDSGSLNVASYDDWANVLATTFVGGAKSAGINIYAVSAQNEPDFDSQGRWNMCLYSPSQMVDFTKVLGPKLHALNPPVKLIAAESECWGCAAPYFSAIESDSTSLAQTDILAAHDYTYGAQATVVPPGKRLWETEVSPVNQPWDATMTMGIWGAKRIFDNLTTASVNAFHWWWFDNFGETQGLIGGDNPPPKLAFAFGNFSRFIRPGFVRVTVSGAIPNGVDMTAFQGPSGQLVIVAINENSADANVAIGLKAATASQLTPWLTSPSSNLAEQSAIPVVSGTCSANLPAQSVTTFVSP